jgi:hypothetical protein
MEQFFSWASNQWARGLSMVALPALARNGWGDIEEGLHNPFII